MAALTLDALLRSLKKGAPVPEPVYLLHGDEDVLKDEAVRALVDSAVGSSRDFNLDVRFAPDLTPESFHALVNTPPMMAERRAVVIRGVEQVGKRKTKLRDEVVRYLASPNPTTVLVLVVAAGEEADADLVRASAAVAVEAALERRAARAAQLVEPVLEQAGMSGVKILSLLGTHLVGTALARAERDRGVSAARLPDTIYRHLQSVRPYGMRSYKEEAARWTAWSALWTARELGRALRAALAADNALKTATVSDDRGIVTQLVLGFAATKREAA